MHYLPLAPGFFAILVGFFFIVLILRSVRYAYESLGVSSNTAIVLLLATLIGSFFNIPIAELSPERAMSHHHVAPRCRDPERDRPSNESPPRRWRSPPDPSPIIRV